MTGTYKLSKDDMEGIRVDAHLFRRYINVLFGLSVPELHDRLRSHECNALEAAIIAILLRAIMEGDANRLDMLLNRAIGRVKAEVEVTQSSPYADKSLDELVNIKRELDRRNGLTLKRLAMSEGDTHGQG